VFGSTRRGTPKADIAGRQLDVRFVPKAEVAVIRSVELIVQPDAHDVVGEMSVLLDATAKDVEVSSDPRSI
jgi:hypothetical protein